MERMKVTPWSVEGKVNYEHLIKEFGVSPITDELISRIRKITGEVHLQLRRKIFFAHRDLDFILDKYERGEKFVLYTGRGPSGPVHIGHIVPWIFTKWLQEKFGVKLYFQVTDDERFLYNPSRQLSKEEIQKYVYDNILDVIAIGFDERKTEIVVNTKAAGALYNIAIEVARHVTLSTVKAIFGFKDEDNIGIVFFPAIQAAPAFLESKLTGVNAPCLIPAAINQDPYWRMTRDVAPKIGYYKPAQIHSRFLPALTAGGKMSASIPESAIYLKDSDEEVEYKIMNAFTGGRATKKEQKKLGGQPEICSIYQFFSFLFEENDEELMERYTACRSGELLCGECKAELTSRIKKFLHQHRKKREKAKDKIDEFLFKG